MNWKPTKLRDFFKYYDSNNPNHVAAVDILQSHAAAVMNDEELWVTTYRGTTETSTDYIDKAASIIADFEGFVSMPYLCPAGVWTIGYGSTYYPDGSLVKPEDRPLTRKEAYHLLQHHIDHVILYQMTRTIPSWGSMNDNQKAAIISFAYNLGSNFYNNSGFTSISKALRSPADWHKVPDALMLYVNPGSTYEAGLRRRRAAEVELWNGKGQYA